MPGGDAGRGTDERAEEVLSATASLERMQAALVRLPRFTREVFLAHRLDDLSYVEIAARTGVSTRRVEREIARAIVALDRALSKPSPCRRPWRRWLGCLRPPSDRN